MFTLGAITCPKCETPLTLLSFTASTFGYRGDATLRCQTCPADYSLTATLTDLLPVLPPSPRVEEQEPAQVEGLEDLEHVTTDHHQHHASDVKTDDGFYPCPQCDEVLDRPQAFAAHQRKHEVKAPCPHGCGRMLKPSGVGRHVASGCPSLKTTPTQEEPCPPPPTPDASSADRAGSSKRPAAGSAPSATGPTPTPKKTTAKASAPTTPKASTTSAAAAPTSTDEPNRAPIGGRTSAVCGMVDEAGPCGRVKGPGDKGWRRARTSGGWMDLCDDHADASDDEVAALLSADRLPALT